MKKIIVVLLISALLLILGLTVKPALCSAVVKVDPSLIEYNTDATGQQFTVAVKIVDVTNLYGFDIKFRWNTTFLDYVSHSVRVPKDTYPDGVLWNPVISVMNEVNTTAGTYWIAYTSRWPAPTFNGSGTVFNMTFSVKHHPVQPEPTANIKLELYSTDLAASDSSSIPHTTQDGTVILYALAAGAPDMAVTNVTTWKTIVGRGWTSNISVTVANQGDSAETFNVTLFANMTIIATKTVTNLQIGDFSFFEYSWNTSGLEYGNYTLKAVAETVPGETNTADNNFTCIVPVHVGVPGDVSGSTRGIYDQVCNMKDVAYLVILFNTKPTSPNWNPNADVSNDEVCNMKDIAIAIAYFNKHE